ncbi:SPOR domain-containing protein [Agaribacterium sp. ZY112]|uniref:SPOR domain-containing protein n=1 Tax=Agaribacterium sp. ZY112 TaxID=3233574 RepID=UPI003526B9F4
MTGGHEQTVEYFSTPALAGVLQQLKHLCFFGSDVLLVEGPTFSGKTALKQELSRQLQSQDSEAVLTLACWSAVAGLELEHVVFELLDLLGLPKAQSAGQGLQFLRSFIQSILSEQRLVVILVDDAHLLSDEVLSALLGVLQSSTAAYGLRFVLFAEPKFSRRIDEFIQLDLQAYDFHLPSFSVDELQRFLDFSLPSFSDVADKTKLSSISTLWSHSKGLPGVALCVAKKELENLQVELAGAGGKRGFLPLIHIVALSLLVALLLLLFLYRGAQKEEGSVEIEMSPGQFELESPARLLVSPSPEVVNDSAEQVSPELVLVELKPSPEPSLSQIPTDMSPSAEQLPEQAVLEFVSDSQPTMTLSDDEQLLLSLDGNSYVLQVFAAGELANLRRFLAKAKTPNVLSYRRKRSGKAPLNIVVIGPYEDLTKAKSALKLLPEHFRQSGAWPKKVDLVQREITDFSGL